MVGGAAEGVSRPLERCRIGGSLYPAWRQASESRHDSYRLQPDRAPVVLEPSSQDYPRARPRRTRSAACTGAAPAAASSRSCRGCVSDAAASRIRPGPVRAPLSGRRPATAGPAGAPPKARMAVGRPLAVPAVKEEIVLDAFGEVLSAVYRADFIVPPTVGVVGVSSLDP